MDEAAGEGRDLYVARLYDSCATRLYRYALMILADARDAEDVIQQVFAALLAERALPAVPEAYLRRAVRNAAYSLFRRRRTVRQAAERQLLAPVATDTSREEQLALEAAICQLPPEQREALHLHVYEGLTFKEIGEMTGESINTVAARYRYAVTRLREILG